MDIGELFGWMQTLLQSLGVWETMGTMLSITLIVGTTMTVWRILTRG